MISLWNWDIGTFLFSYFKLFKKIKRGKRKKGKIKSKGKFEIRKQKCPKNPRLEFDV
jgi:hypothetical protein